jgi:hypothetical protein
MFHSGLMVHKLLHNRRGIPLRRKHDFSLFSRSALNKEIKNFPSSSLSHGVDEISEIFRQ